MNTTAPLIRPLRAASLALSAAATLFAVASTTSTAEAAIAISLHDNAPVEGIYKANVASSNPANDELYWRGEPGGTAGDQVKTLGQGLSTAGATSPLSLTAITFQIHDFHTDIQGKTLQLSVYEADAAHIAPTSANLVIEHQGLLPELEKSGYLTLTLDAPITLQADKHYSFILSFTDATSSDTSVKRLSLSTIGSGIENIDKSRRWNGVDGTYSATHQNGLVFYAHATPIPEANVYTLLGGAALLGLGFGRRFWNS